MAYDTYFLYLVTMEVCLFIITYYLNMYGLFTFLFYLMTQGFNMLSGYYVLSSTFCKSSDGLRNWNEKFVFSSKKITIFYNILSQPWELSR